MVSYMRNCYDMREKVRILPRHAVFDRFQCILASHHVLLCPFLDRVKLVFVSDSSSHTTLVVHDVSYEWALWFVLDRELWVHA